MPNTTGMGDHLIFVACSAVRSRSEKGPRRVELALLLLLLLESCRICGRQKGHVYNLPPPLRIGVMKQAALPKSDQVSLFISPCKKTDVRHDSAQVKVLFIGHDA